jgi:hypothetical protein
MKKYSVLLAAAVLVISTGIASAKSRDHRTTPYGTGITGDLSSTNVLAGAGSRGYRAPHEVPENGGAASIVQPGSTPN